MKSILKDLIVFTGTFLVMLTGLVGGLIAAQTPISLWYIWMPASFISWLVILPAYHYWHEAFKKFFSSKDDSNKAE